MSYRWADYLYLIGVAALYLLLAKISPTFQGEAISLMCFSSGLALAVLLVGGKKYWPGIWAGAYLADMFLGRSIPVSFFIATAYVLGALLAVRLLNLAGDFDLSLRRKQDFMRLLLASLLSPSISAAGGVVTLYVSGALSAPQLPAVLLQWWMQDVFGVMLITPMILIWRRPHMKWLRVERISEFVLLLALAFVCGQAIFLGGFERIGGQYAEEYWMFIFVAWAGIRFGRHGVQLVILLVLTQAWLGMLLGTGHWGSDPRHIGAVKFWGYLIEMSAIGIALATAIREKNDTREVLSKSEERFRSMFRKHGAVMLLVDPDSGLIVDANPAAADFYGYPEGALRSMSIGQINDLSVEEAVASMKRALREEQKHFTFTHRLSNGEARLVNVHPSPVEVSGRMLLFSIVTDITESKKMERELEIRANTDPLTGLSNRRRFMELAEQELARAQRYAGTFALLLLDVDHFKRVNDTYGHKVGDIVLQHVAGLCRSTLREVDVIGRFGGEEFAIILPETDAGQAVEVGERLRQAVAEMPFAVSERDSLQLTVSIGVASLASPAAGIDELLQQADQALYAAKRGGRNNVRLFAEEAGGSTLPLFNVT